MSMIGNFLMVSDDQIASLLAEPETIEELLYPEDEELPINKAMDVDKAWDGIHFLLCGEKDGGDPPLNFVAAGGSPIGDVDVGYGPARAFTSQQVRAIAEALAPIDKAALDARFDAKQFAEIGIYPQIWNEPKDVCLGYLLEYFEDLKGFLLRARDAGQGLIVYIN